MSQSALEIAEKLLQSAESEDEYRAAASRAYIAAFQHVVSHPKISDFNQTRTGDDHRGLIEFLKKSTDPGIRKLGYQLLPRLRALRNQADYELDMPFTQGFAVEALERATDIIFDFLPK